MDEIEITVAMAAHSIIYAPFYWAVEQFNAELQGEAKITLLQEAFGDQLAFNKIKSNEVQLCVADPMVVAQEAQKSSSSSCPIPGRVIAFITKRPALWAITAPKNPLALLNEQGDPEKSATLVGATYNNKTSIDIGALSYFKGESTAQQILKYMKKHWDWEWSEKADACHINISCEPVSVYRRQLIERGENICFAWHKFDRIQDFPFTAIISNNKFSKERVHGKLIVKLLKLVQLALDKKLFGNEEEIVDSFIKLSEYNKIEFKTASIYKTMCESVLLKIRQRDSSAVFPKSIRMDDIRVMDGWEFSYSDLWGIGQSTKSSFVAFDAYLDSVSHRYSRCAAPGKIFIIRGLVNIFRNIVISGSQAKHYSGLVAAAVSIVLIAVTYLFIVPSVIGTNVISKDSELIARYGISAFAGILGVLLVPYIHKVWRWIKRRRSDNG